MSLVPPEQRGQARVRFTPGPGIPLTLIAHGDERVEREFTVYPFPSIDGFDRSYIGLDRAVMPLLGFRLPEPPRVELGFRPLFDLGENATVNAEATSFALALFRAQAIEFVGPFFPDGRVTIPADILRESLNPELIELIEFWNWLNTKVAYIEQQVGARITVHPAPYDQDEVDTIASCADTLRTRGGEGQFKEATADANPRMIEVEVERFKRHPEIAFRVIRDVLGTPVNLGIGLATLPDVSVVPLPSLLALPNQQVTLKIVARGSGDVDFRLLDPGEDLPPEALRMPDQPQGGNERSPATPPSRLWLPSRSAAP